MRAWSTGALLALLTSCAQPASVEAPLLGGVFDPDDPAVVTVLELDARGEVLFFCSGVLVSPRVVLTSGHCLNETSDFAVYFGAEPFAASDPTSMGTIDVIDSVVHPDFAFPDGPTFAPYDIGAVAMAEPAPVDFIEMNRVPLEGRVGEAVRLVGLGRTAVDAMDSGVKRQVTTSLTRVDELRTYFGSPDASTCNGDSGAPQLMDFGGVERAVSVNSGGETLDCSGASVGYRLDAFAASLLDPFIRGHDPGACDADGLCAESCASADPDCPCAEDGFCGACPVADVDPDCDLADAGVAADAGAEPPPDGGCGCRAAPTRGGAAWLVLLLGAALRLRSTR